MAADELRVAYLVGNTNELRVITGPATNRLYTVPRTRRINGQAWPPVVVVHEMDAALWISDGTAREPTDDELRMSKHFGLLG